MEPYLTSTLGVVVSVVLFLITYRGTVGARKERISAANSDLERILLRRIVLEEYAPNATDVGRLIDGKARDYNVRSIDVLPFAELLNTVYTRVMESELIQAGQRDEILSRIERTLDQPKAEPDQDQDIDKFDSSKLQSTQLLIVILAVAVSILGGITTIIPEISTLGSLQGAWELLPMIATTASLSFGLIIIFYYISRIRTSQEAAINRRDDIHARMVFRSEVRRTLEDMGDTTRMSRSKDGFEYLVERRNQKLAITVKTWSSPPPVSFLSRIAKRLKDAAEESGATEAIIVARTLRGSTSRAGDKEGVKILTLRQLRNYLKHTASSSLPLDGP